MMSCNNKEKTYWEGMDETANIWAASIFGAVTAYAIGAAEQQENGDEKRRTRQPVLKGIQGILTFVSVSVSAP